MADGYMTLMIINWYATDACYPPDSRYGAYFCQPNSMGDYQMTRDGSDLAAIHKETAAKVMRLSLSLIAAVSLVLAIASLSPAAANGNSSQGYSYGSSDIYNQNIVNPPASNAATPITPPAGTTTFPVVPTPPPVAVGPAPMVLGVPAPTPVTLPTCVPGPLGDCRGN